MRTVESEERSSKITPLLEWRTCDSDEVWQTPAQVTLTTAVSHPDVTPHTSWAARYWRIGAALLVLLAAIGGWTWSVAQRGVDQIEADLRDSVELDLWTTDSQDDGPLPASEQGIHKRFTSAQGNAPRPLISTVQWLALPGGMAIVQLVTQSEPDQPALRQTRFYRQTAEGWLLTKPDDKLWGPPRRLESSHFVFEFRQNDAQVVTAVAPQMDAVYTELQRNFDLTPNAEKLVIEVSVERVTGVTHTHQWAYEPLVVPSPAVYMAPLELSDNDILAQSIVLPLLDYLAQRAIKDHSIPYRWQPLLRGLQLRQLWNLDVPLARWHQDLVKWLYIDAPNAFVGQKSSMPFDGYTQLCAMHRLWILSPIEIGVPLECTANDHLTWSPRRWATYVPHTPLSQISMPLADWEIPFYGEAKAGYLSNEAVVIANLIEYADAGYGNERLPVLLAGLAHYDDWDTLILAVYGVSAADFEAGWRSYLAQQYNVSLEY